MTERLPTRVVFKVTGRGRFPVDMLRHDCCWPVCGGDADNILGTDTRFVVLSLADCGWGDLSGPTVARWASFGWACEIIAAYRGSENVTDRVREAANN